MNIKIVAIACLSLSLMGSSFAARIPTTSKTPPPPTTVPIHVITPAQECSVTVALAGSVYSVDALSTIASNAGGAQYTNGSYDMQITAWDPALKENHMLAYIPNTKAAFSNPTLACQNSPSTCVATKDATNNLLDLTFNNVPCDAHRIVFNTKFVSTNGQTLTTNSTFSDVNVGHHNLFSPQVVMRQSDWGYSTTYFTLTKGTPYVVSSALGRTGCNSSNNYCRSGDHGTATNGYCYWNKDTFNYGAVVLGILPQSANCNSDN